MSGDPDLPGGTSEPEERAAELFAAFLARREAGEELELEELCAAHPDLAQELRALFGHWSALQRALGERAPGGSLAERIRRLHGLEADPTVILEPEPEREQSPSSELLERLAGRRGLFGRYRLKGEVARGGMGAILRVWDEDLKRTLAMKVVLGRGGAAKHETPPVEARTLARFLEEAQVTGQLDHPGIVPVHELGLDEQGRVYFTMKLVKGKTLAAVFDELGRGAGEWTRARALGALQKACDALAYAHAKGVVHRDLKPANVMVGRYGEVYVMDWGLARVMGRKDAKDVRIRPAPVTASDVVTERRERAGADPGSPLCTMDGDVVGTPAYMPPEQARGNLEEIGPHSDVYALGAMLYHLLSGQMPYVPPDATLNAYAIWARVQEGPPRSLAELARDAPAELVAIADKAMARDWRARYRDMAELARDLSAFLEGRVVRAYESGAWAEAKKWVRRNRPLAVALAAAVLLLVVGLATSLVLRERALESAVLAESRREQAQASSRLAEERRTQAEESRAFAEEQRTRADEARTLAEERRTQTEGALALAEERRVAAEESERRAKRSERDALAQKERAEGSERDALAQKERAERSEQDAMAQKERAEEALRDARWQSYLANLRLAETSFEAGNFAEAQRRLASCPEEHRNFEWLHLELAVDPSLATLEGHTGAVLSVAFSPDGTRLASASEDETVRLWDAATGAAVAAFEGYAEFAFSREGARLASTSKNGLLLSDAVAGEVVAELEGHAGFAFSPDGARFATGSKDGSLCLWDARTGEALVTLEGHTGAAIPRAFGPGGTLLASTSEDGTIRLWNTATGRVRATLEGSNGLLALATPLAFSPDGARLASVSLEETDKLLPRATGVRVWDTATGELVGTLETPSKPLGFVLDLVFSPDGARLASVELGTIRLWNPAAGELVATLPSLGPAPGLAFDPDGTRLATASADGTVRVLDARTGEVLAALEGHTAPVTSVAFSPDGARLASASEDETVRLWETSTGESLALRGHDDVVSEVAFSPDGRFFASASRDGTVRVWAVGTTGALATLDGHAGSARSLAFSPDGSFFASASRDATVRLWDVAEGEPLAKFEGRSSPVIYAGFKDTRVWLTPMAFSPDGALLASTRGTAVRLWDARRGEILATLEGHTHPVFSLVFSPDNKRLASASADETVRLWDVTTGDVVATLGGTSFAWALENPSRGSGAHFGPFEGYVGWMSMSIFGQKYEPLDDAHLALQDALAFSPDGARLASAAAHEAAPARRVPEAHDVRVWDAATGAVLATLEGHTGLVFALAFSPDGTLLASASTDTTVRLWNMAGGAGVDAVLAGHTDTVSSVAFAPDGARLASASLDGTVRLWDARTGEPLATLGGHAGAVTSFAFTPDGERLVSASKDEAIRIWDVRTGEPLVTLRGHDGMVTSLAFSPDGARLASGSLDGTIRFWESDAGEARQLWRAAERRRAIDGLLDPLFDEHVLLEPVLAALDRTSDLDSALREAAVRRARWRGRASLPADELARRAWVLVDPDGERRGDPLHALALTRAALELAPEDHAVRKTLAWALFACGHREEALAECQQHVLGLADDEELRASLERLRALLSESVPAEHERR